MPFEFPILAVLRLSTAIYECLFKLQYNHSSTHFIYHCLRLTAGWAVKKQSENLLLSFYV